MDGPTLTMAEAVRQATCSESTLRRKLKAGEVEGAERNEDGSWSIPIAGLVTAGLLSKTTPPDKQAAVFASEIAGPYERETLADRIVELEHRAETLRIERDAARAELERADQTIEAQAIALRALEGGLDVDRATGTSSPPPRSTISGGTDEGLRGRLRRWLS